jgi:hypothetical protein
VASCLPRPSVVRLRAQVSSNVRQHRHQVCHPPPLMRKRSHRQAKKLHRVWFAWLYPDASVSRFWRQRLFASSPGEVIVINKESCQGLPTEITDAIRRYRLSYSVSVVPASAGPRWLTGRTGSVLFKFWATEYPSIQEFSANNPDVVGALRVVRQSCRASVA